MKKFALITHDDLDGIGCGVVTHFANTSKDDHDVFFKSIKEKEAFINEFVSSGKFMQYENVIVADLSLSDELAKVFETLNEKSGTKFYMFDHHDTASHLNSYQWALVEVPKTEDGKEDIEKAVCGAQMLFAWFSETIDKAAWPLLEAFVNYVSDYDNYRWKTNGNLMAKKINDVSKFYTHYEAMHKFIDRINKDKSLVTDKEEFALECIRRQNEDYFERKLDEVHVTNLFMTGEKYCIGVLFTDDKTRDSELGNRACERYPQCDFIVMLDLSARTASLRSIEKEGKVLHLGNQIAKKYEGGGHPHAAGFIMPQWLVHEIRKMAFEPFTIMSNDLNRLNS